MFEGSDQPTNTAIHYAECRKRIEEMGMHFSMKRFITAIMMVTNIKTVECNKNNGDFTIDDKWHVDGEGLRINEPLFKRYVFNTNDVVIDVYCGEEINNYDNYTHKTKNVIFEFCVNLATSSIFTLIPILLGYGLSNCDAEFLFVIGFLMMGLGTVGLIPIFSFLKQTCKTTFVSKKEMQKFVANQHKKN